MGPWDYGNDAKPGNTTKNKAKADPKNLPKRSMA